MNREELEHAIRAAGDVARDPELIVLGSQAVLGQFPDAPNDLLFSREVDVYPKNHPERSIEIDGVLGELSTFHETHRFYVHGVGPETAVLPAGWEQRLVPVANSNTRGITGWCLEAHDLAASKLAAGREKDMDYVRAMMRHNMIRGDTMAARIAVLPLSELRQAQMLTWLTSTFDECMNTAPRVTDAGDSAKEEAGDSETSVVDLDPPTSSL
ncbi:MAG: DUF6036 family nucleotidyltransferase [Gemmatimonadaceae bacterium]